MDFYEELNAIRQQELNNWFMTEKQAKEAYEKTVNDSAQHLRDKYLGDKDMDLHYGNRNYLDAELKFQNLQKKRGEECYGYTTQDNNVSLDRFRAWTNRDGSWLTAIHEGVHVGQNQIAMSGVDALSSPELDLICNTYWNGQREMFDIPTVGSAYINSSSHGPESNNDYLRSCLYKNQYLEREARLETMEIGQQCGVDVSSIQNELSESLHFLQHHYGQIGAQDTDIYQMLDNAQRSVIHKEMPATPTEASIAYDMSALMCEQEANLLKNRERQELARSLHDPNVKAEKLHNAGFDYAQVIPYYEASSYSVQEIANLSQIARDESPMFMANAMCQYGEEVVPLLNQESFDQWYFSKDNNLPEEVIEQVSSVLGEEYSRESIDEVLDLDVSLDEILSEEDIAIESMEPDVDVDELCLADDIELGNTQSIDLGDSQIGIQNGLDGFDQGAQLNSMSDGIGEVGEEVAEAVEEAIEEALEVVERALIR